MSGEGAGVEMFHHDGVDWVQAPAPFVLHRHRTQSIGWSDDYVPVARCACGSTQVSGRWIGEPLRGRRMTWTPRRGVDFGWIAAGIGGLAAVVALVWAVVVTGTPVPDPPQASVCPTTSSVVVRDYPSGQTTCYGSDGRTTGVFR